MDASDELPGAGLLANHDGVDPEHRVGTCGNEPEMPQSANVSLSDSALRDDGEGQILRQRNWEEPIPWEDASSMISAAALRTAALSLLLDNGGDMCYANSAFICSVWSFLMRSSFAEGDWGSFARAYCSLLTTHEHLPIRIDDMGWYQRLISTWDDRQGQADSAEFTGLLLGGMHSPVLSNHWQRRVQNELQIQVHDENDDFQPLTLQIDPSSILHNTVHLSELLRMWHAELGMCGAFVTAADLIGVHLDRFFQPHQGQLRKLDTHVIFESAVQIPVFAASTEDTLEIDWIHYIPVSAFAHLGTIHGGHYQALLRAPSDSTTAAVGWYHCDDCRIPLFQSSIPDGYHKDVTCVWLVKETALATAQPILSGPSNPHDDMLDLLTR